MKLLLTIDGISFYTNPAAIKRGVGQSQSVNSAARSLFKELMENRNSESDILNKTVGIGGSNYSGHSAQINII